MNTEIHYFNMPELSDLFYLMNLADKQGNNNLTEQYKGFEQGFNLAVTLLLGKDIKILFEFPDTLSDRIQDTLGHQLWDIAAERVAPIIKESEKRCSDRFALYMNMYNYGFIDGKRAERERRKIKALNQNK